MIRAVFFDIDGTLVSFNTHRISEASKKALAELRRKGVKTFIATGRHLMAINMLEDLSFDGYITMNGGICLAGKETIVYSHPVNPEDIRALVRYLETRESFPVIFVREKDSFITCLDSESGREKVNRILEMLNYPLPPFRNLSEALQGDVFQVIAFFPEEQEAEIMQHMPHCETTRWNPLFADIIPKGSGKHIGIDRIIQYFGIERSQTMAFGDGGNDISMLQHVATGIAMGNAKDEVKQNADYVTLSVDQDGVSHALKHFGLID